MIAEKLHFAFDIARLRHHFRTHIAALTPVWQNEQFGDWNILDSTGQADYLTEVIEEIRASHLQPRHVHWTIITAGGATSWHRAISDNHYGVRLHIPVITNPDCAFLTNEGSYHMPADGSCYLVAVNKMHRMINLGSEDRIHIIMDVIDEAGISQYHSLEQHAMNRAA